MILFQITTKNRDQKSIRFNGTDDTTQLKMFSRNTALSPDSYLHSHKALGSGLYKKEQKLTTVTQGS